MGGSPFLFQGGAGLAESVQNGAAAVHLKAVVSRDVGQKLFADGTFQMDKVAAGNAFEVEVMAAIPLPYVLVDVGGLGVAAVFAYRSLGAQLGKVTIQGTFMGHIFPVGHGIQFSAKLVDGELSVGIAFQKFQKSLPSRGFVDGHVDSPFLRTFLRCISIAQESRFVNKIENHSQFYFKKSVRFFGIERLHIREPLKIHCWENM
jgi:hypothetical protein